jgi:hypothetical protein
LGTGFYPGTKIAVYGSTTVINREIADLKRAMRTGVAEKPRFKETNCLACFASDPMNAWHKCQVVDGKWLCRAHAAKVKSGK